MQTNGESESSRRKHLKQLFGYCCWIMVAAVSYVLLDFAIDVRPPAVHSSYRFSLDRLEFDQPLILRQDNLSILVIRRSNALVAALQQPSAALQDAASSDSRQPDYARNPLRSRTQEYFVSYAIGTDFGCALQVNAGRLREICGDATYDFAGRALKSTRSFPNLPIPDHKFSNKFSNLTINP